MPSVFFRFLEPLLVGKLKVLALQNIALNSSAAKALSRSLQPQHCSLVTLTLRNCCFLSNASKQLAFGIGRNTSLHRIAFNYCQLGSADFKLLADALRDNQTLEEVEIQQPSEAMMTDKAAIQALKEGNQKITFKLTFY